MTLMQIFKIINLLLLKFSAYIVKISLNRISGVAVNMSPCHGEDRGFDPLLVRHSQV